MFQPESGYPLDTHAVTRDQRRLRLQEPDTRTRVAAGKRNRKYRDRKNHQTKPGGTRH